ncbi:MAG: HlyD family efflux transporter periplasmic adaptor subunit [Bacteroidia bacterium]|nr:HlyD family efflux transporter periplasmic adaptor subunit [Bacteroidia bacterium]
MMSIKITAPFYSLLLLLILFTTACRRNKTVSETDASVITPVTIAEVINKPVTETIELPAVSAFLNKSIVRSATSGTVENISIVPGEYVKKGQVLCTIRTREASAMNNSLIDDSTFTFKGRIDIISPTSGVINSISHQNGDFVQEGDEIAVISDQNSLVFILDTPFEFAKYVEKNRNCKIQLPGDQIINGNITGNLPEMDSQAQTVRYVIKPVFAGRLPANLNALVRIVKSSKDKAFVLPKSAVLSNETQTEFWVMKLINDSIAIKIPVKKGYENNEEVEITDPEFIQTDRIILTGSYGLPDTARVIVK